MAGLAAVGLLLAGCGGSGGPGATPGSTSGSTTDSTTGSSSTTTATVEPAPTGVGIHKIRHVVIIMQENRSFDSYFGTYPGADGIPGLAGNPGTVPCVPDPITGSCVRPFHDRQDRSLGGPHSFKASVADENGGAMNGFVGEQERGMAGCEQTFNPACGNGGGSPDVMGYHDGSDIPNYWAYAHDFVLQDHMFEPVSGFSLPAHLFLVSDWSAQCMTAHVARSCVNQPDVPGQNGLGSLPIAHDQDFAWTDLTYLLHKAGVSWGY